MKRFVLGVSRYDSPMMCPNKNGDFVEFDEVNKLLIELLELVSVVFPCKGTQDAENVKIIKKKLEYEIEE